MVLTSRDRRANPASQVPLSVGSGSHTASVSGGREQSGRQLRSLAVDLCERREQRMRNTYRTFLKEIFNAIV